MSQKIGLIDQLRKTFKKKKLVLLYLDLMEAKTYLLENLFEKCYQALLDTQKKLEKERRIPKQILSLLNEVWASYQWKRENYDRCHQSLLSFLVYSDLNKLSCQEKQEVIYRLIACNLFFNFSFFGHTEFAELFSAPASRNCAEIRPFDVSGQFEKVSFAPLVRVFAEMFSRIFAGVGAFVRKRETDRVL